MLMNYLRSRLYPQADAAHQLTRPDISHPIAGGCWSWFSDPRAVYYNGKTYFGYANAASDAVIVSQADGNAATTFTLKASLSACDDHVNPSILLRASDHKILAFYSSHDGTDRVIRWRISTNAEDISAWAAEGTMAPDGGTYRYTYTNPIQLTGETNSPIYLFYRRHNDDTTNAIASYVKSTDGGATFGSPVNFATVVYTREIANGTARIDFVASNSPQEVADFNIYHFYYISGSFYKSDGTQITASQPFATSEMTQVYDGSTNKSWCWDIAIDNNGSPVIVFAKFISSSDHRYMYATWSGSSWTVNEIAAGGGSIEASPAVGQEYYSGGISIDKSNVNTVYLSKSVNGVFEIWKYMTIDGGSTWSGTAITTNSKQTNARPVIIRNYGNYAKVIWWRGPYITYQNFGTHFLTSTL